MPENKILKRGDQKSNTLYFLTGPTAVGKTTIALEWAEANDAEILSCDALLFYRGMNIGTAKPPREALERVPHHGIDLVSVRESYSIEKYLKLARKVVTETFKRKSRLLITGGSGFYLKSFFYPVVDEWTISEEIQRYVQTLETNEGIVGLRRALHALNPDGLEGVIDLYNPRRLARALMRCIASGKTVLELRESFLKKNTPFDGFEKKVVCLMRSREDLKERINQRTTEMIAKGLVDEVRFLKAAGIETNPAAATAIGYRETLTFLDQGGSLDALHGHIAQNTTRLVKKQLTWLRKQIPVDDWVFLEPGQSGDYRTLFRDHSCRAKDNL